jgi:biopolymer transport protein ExbB/TolQ
MKYISFVIIVLIGIILFTIVIFYVWITLAIIMGAIEMIKEYWKKFKKSKELKT